MRCFGLLVLKEEAAVFSSPIAYAVITVFLLIMGYRHAAAVSQPSAELRPYLLPDVRAVHADS
jgi:hypothetical protein